MKNNLPLDFKEQEITNKFYLEYAKCLKLALDIHVKSGKSVNSIDISLINELFENDKTKYIISPLFHVLKVTNGDKKLVEVLKYYDIITKETVNTNNNHIL